MSMLKSIKFIICCVTLLFSVLTFNLWIQVPEISAGSWAETYQTGQQLTGTSEVSKEPPNEMIGTSKTVPGAAPDFRVDSIKTVSPSTALRSPLFIKAFSKWVTRLEPNQGGIIWLSIFVTLLVAFDFKRWISWRNADILLILVLSFLLIDLTHWQGDLGDPVQGSLFGIVFLGIFLVSVLILARALVGAFTVRQKLWVPNLPTPFLVGLTILLFACNTLLALVRFPNDCGYYTNLGAERMLETGKFPYGDPMLRGGAAATYGPVLYIAHIPFQLGLSHIKPSVEQDEQSFYQWIVTGGQPHYLGPPILATKLTLLFFHLLGIVGFILIGRQLGGVAIGWGLACLYIGSAYVQGLGGEAASITGMTYISHIAPAAITILAFAALSLPFLAGALLATAAGVLFYPAFFFPLWLGYYFWRGKEWIRFTAGFLIFCLVIGSSVLLMTQSSENESVLKVIYESTIRHQEGNDAYGSSTFSFWGTHPRLAAFWQEPYIPGWYLLKPSFLVFATFIAASFFMARGRTVTQFAFLTAAVAIAVQLWKSHAGGTYVEWYLPFLLIGLFAQRSSEEMGTTDHSPVDSDSGKEQTLSFAS